jgi:hypothetical protein
LAGRTDGPRAEEFDRVFLHVNADGAWAAPRRARLEELGFVEHARGPIYWD